MTVHAAHLRVYEPLAAFDGAERRRWEEYVAAGAAPARSAAGAVERAAALRAVAGAVPSLPVLPDHAHVTEVDGVTLVSPWRTGLRALEALEEFVADLPDVVADAFVPRAVTAAALEELDRRRAADPDLRSHALTSPWQVPLRWFVLVEAHEKEVSLGAPAGTGGAPAGRRAGRALVYRTAMSRARRRTARALAVLRRTVEDGVVTAGVEDLARWLEEFHPRSLVELDYGGLVDLLDDEALTADDSAADVARALTALADGDPVAAASAYARVSARAKSLQAVESAN